MKVMDDVLVGGACVVSAVTVWLGNPQVDISSHDAFPLIDSGCPSVYCAVGAPAAKI